MVFRQHFDALLTNRELVYLQLKRAEPLELHLMFLWGLTLKIKLNDKYKWLKRIVLHQLQWQHFDFFEFEFKMIFQLKFENTLMPG